MVATTDASAEQLSGRTSTVGVVSLPPRVPFHWVCGLTSPLDKCATLFQDPLALEVISGREINIPKRDIVVPQINAFTPLGLEDAVCSHFS